jgi:hypothetical protein
MLAGIGLLFLTAPALAQDGPKAEIGTGLGLTVLVPDEGDAITIFGIPGAGTGSLPAIVAPVVYATVFATPQLMVEPQLHLSVISGGDETLFSVAFMGQLGYLFTPEKTGSPYTAVHGGILAVDLGGFSDTETSGAVGLGVGYRFEIGSGAAMRVEARYRRWFGNVFRKTNDIALVFGIGAVIR